MEATCKDNLIKCLWQDCSTLVQGDYVVHLSRDACGKCDISLVSFSPSWADCTLVTNCINSNVSTQAAINSLINARINFPSTNGNYILTITWGVATRTPYTPSGSGSNVPNKPTTPWVYELTIDGSGNATWTIATSGGSWSCADTENCIRTNAWVRDAIQDMIDASLTDVVTTTTLCSDIISAWCSWWTSNFWPIPWWDYSANIWLDSNKILRTDGTIITWSCPYIPWVNPTVDPNYWSATITHAFTPTVSWTYTISVNWYKAWDPRTFSYKIFDSTTNTLIYTEWTNFLNAWSVLSTNQTLVAWHTYYIAMACFQTDYQVIAFYPNWTSVISRNYWILPAPSF